jgi:hypothetical protein
VFNFRILALLHISIQGETKQWLYSGNCRAGRKRPFLFIPMNRPYHYKESVLFRMRLSPDLYVPAPPKVQLITTHSRVRRIVYFDSAWEAIAWLFTSARFLTSPCLPFYFQIPVSHNLLTIDIDNQGRDRECIRTSHLAKRRSMFPRRSAARRGPSLRDLRTARAATAR